MEDYGGAMKTKRLQDIMLAVLLAVTFGLEVYLGAFLAARIGQTSTRQTDSPAAPNVSISDLMAAAR